MDTKVAVEAFIEASLFDPLIKEVIDKFMIKCVNRFAIMGEPNVRDILKKNYPEFSIELVKALSLQNGELVDALHRVYDNGVCL